MLLELHLRAARSMPVDRGRGARATFGWSWNRSRSGWPTAVSLEQVGRDLVQERLEGVVVVLVDEHDVDVGVLQLPRSADPGEPAAED